MRRALPSLRMEIAMLPHSKPTSPLLKSDGKLCLPNGKGEMPVFVTKFFSFKSTKLMLAKARYPMSDSVNASARSPSETR